MTAKKIQTLIQNFGATRNDFPPKMNVSFGSVAEIVAQIAQLAAPGQKRSVIDVLVAIVRKFRKRDVSLLALPQYGPKVRHTIVTGALADYNHQN